MKRTLSKPTTPPTFLTPVPAPTLTAVSGGDGGADPQSGLPTGKRMHKPY